MAKKIGIICAIVIVLAGAFCLYQFTDVFGLKQEKPAATEAAVTPAEETAPAEAPAEEAKPAEEPAPAEAPAEETKPAEEPAPAEAPAEETKPAEEPAPAEAPAEEAKPAEEAAAAPAEETPAEEPAAEEPKADNPVLATIDGKEVYLSDAQAMLNSLVSGGYITDSTDYKTALDYLIQSRILSDKITELGFDQFTDAEKADFAAKAETEWQEAIQQYVSYFGGGDDTNVEQTRQEAIEYYNAHGISEETIAKQFQNESSQEKLENYLLEGKDITVSEEEIRAIFDDAAEQDMAAFDGNIGTYELYQAYYGQQFWFVPEGYRGIIHILLDVDEGLMDAYTKAQSAYEESKTEEKPDGDEYLKTTMENARDAILDSKKETIDDVYARLEKGEDFTDLISEYNQDPGMKDEARLADGYHVHKESLLWDPVFTEAAFSEKMIKPGDVSDPVVGKNGIHILYYLRDVPSGKIEMTDDIRNDIKAYLETSKKNQIFSEALASWQEQHEIVYNQEAIYALTAPAAEATEAPAE